MESLIKVYTANGNFDIEQYFTVLYGGIPCKYTFTISAEDQTFEVSEIHSSKLIHLFRDIKGIRDYIEDELCDLDEDKEYTDLKDLEIPLMEQDGRIILGELKSYTTIAADGKVIYVCWNKIIILYSVEEPLENIKKLVNAIFNVIPKTKPEEKAARVGLIRCSNGEYYTTFSDIRKTAINIDENYNDDFLPVYSDIINFLNQRESGLILLWGTPGSGNFYKNNLEF